MSRRDLILAAGVSNPWSDPVELPRDGLEDIAAVLWRNKVSFMALERKHASALSGTPFARYLLEEQRRFDVLRTEFERVRSALASHGIRTVLFKATGLYPVFPHLSSNLDVLVEPGRGDVARQCLWQLGYIELVNVEEPDKYLFRRFGADGMRHTFHLHEAIGWGVPFVEASDVVDVASPSMDDPGVFIPQPAHALLITAAHWFYEEKVLTLGNVYLMAEALRRAPDPDAVIGATAERGWLDGFSSALAVFDAVWRELFGKPGLSSTWRQLADRRPGRLARKTLERVRYDQNVPAVIPFALNKLMYYRKILRDCRRSWARRWSDVIRTGLWAVRWKLHVRSQPPLLVTLSGCDGSGKTLHARRLAEVLDVCDIRTRSVWARGASSPRMAMLLRVAKSLTRTSSERGESMSTGTSEAERMRERRMRVKNPLLRWLFAWAFAADMALTYAVKVRWHLMTGAAVVCDRYVEDALVDFALMSGTAVSSPPFALRLLCAVRPCPHVAVLLDVDPDEALRRKPEEGGTEHLRAAREMFNELADRNGMLVMNTGAGFGDVHEEIARVCLTHFVRRYRTTGNWLLASNPGQLNPGRWRPREVKP